jgi:hypothetical protein
MSGYRPTHLPVAIFCRLASARAASVAANPIPELLGRLQAGVCAVIESGGKITIEREIGFPNTQVRLAIETRNFGLLEP